MGRSDLSYAWKKKCWDVIDRTRAVSIIIMQTKKREKDNTVASNIIKQGVNSNLYINIIREHNA